MQCLTENDMSAESYFMEKTAYGKVLKAYISYKIKYGIYSVFYAEM